MIDAAFIFRSHQDIPGFFDSLFGGIFITKGIPLIAQLGVLFFLPLAIICAVAQSSTHKSFYKWATQFLSLLIFTLLALLLLQPWDELFVNLRHSLHWAEANNFSFNRFSNLEGTVDFLPYFLIGCLGKIGLPITDLAFVFSYLGGILCLYAGIAFLKEWKFPNPDTWGMILLVLYAPLVFNSSHGFTTTLFTAAILWSIYFFYLSPHRKWSFLLFSIIPLIRMEGAFLIFLFLTSDIYLKQRKTGINKNLIQKIVFYPLIFTPLLILSVYRIHKFGSPIPLPIQYKSSMGSLFYFLIGMRNLMADLVSCYGLMAVTVLILCHFLTKASGLSWTKKHSQLFPLSNTLIPLICLTCFSFAYYLSGGDWFPSYWGRYLLPFSLYTILLACSVLNACLPTYSSQQRTLLTGILLGIFASQTLWPISSYWKFFDRTFGRRRTMAKLHYRHIGRGHYRIHHLSQLGHHLGQTTSPSDVIASSEVATIMYYAKRETLDLLGIVNPEIARQPLRRLPDLLRRFPSRSELPYLIFKKINPDLVRKYKPEIVYTFDFILRDILKEIPTQEMPNTEITDDYLFTALRRWSFALKGLVDPLYHGVDDLLRLGYRPIVILYENEFCAMYFVSPKALPQHIDKLKEKGFEGGWKKTRNSNQT